MADPLSPVLVQKLDELAGRAAALEQETLDPGLTKDPQRSRQVYRELGRLRQVLGLRVQVEGLLAQIHDTRELTESGDDPELAALAQDELPVLERAYEAAAADLLDLLLVDDDVSGDSAILEIRAGTGGDEAGLFARDLADIYKRLCDRRGWKLKPLAITENALGGFKEAVFTVEGEGVYRLFRFETGGHRVQRVPITEAQGRIQTSMATVAVLPDAEEVDIQIEDRDLEIQTTTSSGPGGQHVNKTESAVRITHRPTGIVVFCQEERSQHKNKAKAMRLLRARVLDHERQKADAARAAERRSQVGTGDRSQRIRTYNWKDNRCTDHRVHENYSLQSVLEGDLDPIFEDLMRLDREERLKNL